MEILRAENLSYTYPSAASAAIRDLSFGIQKGELICLCGTTGSGKTTLLRLLKPELTNLGKLEGKLTFNGKCISDLSSEESVRIGYVMQDPDGQIVCDKVWHELAFGMENMGMSQGEMKLRVAEICAYFGLGELLHRDVSTLSGGQKQLLNIASVMAMDPEVLLIDEPCAQLDPISAATLTDTIAKINREFGTTVIISEHRLDNILPLADKILALDNGKQVVFANTEEAVLELMEHPRLSESMSAPVKLHHSLGSKVKCPLTVSQGAKFLRDNYTNGVDRLAASVFPVKKAPALEFSNVYFRYEKSGRDVLKNLSLTVNKGEFFCILGENGCGKSTLLLSAASVLKNHGGSIRVFEKKLSKYHGSTLYEGCLAYLPQNPRALCIRDTVREELDGIDTSALPFDFSQLYEKHPYDLSGGESQILALAKALSSKPSLLLLDEPTKGLDSATSHMIGELLKALTNDGVTVVAVTHDTDFAASFAHRCAMMFDGSICSVGEPRQFFSSNIYYTTPYSRMSRGFFKNAVTLEDVTKLCRLNGERRETPR